MIYINQWHVYLPLTSKCMTCGFIWWRYMILYTWYIYTSNRSTYIWHQVYDFWFNQLSRQDTLHMIYIFTSSMPTYIWPHVYVLWFCQLSRKNSLHVIYIYITNLVCYAYFHWLFNPECQHIFQKQTGYICTFSVSLIWAPKNNNNVVDKNRNIYASLNQYHNTE
jgi:hypothetical protein